MMNSNQIGIDYNGVTVMKYGPPASFSFNSFVKFTITVTEKNVILDNGGYDQWVPIPGTVSSKENVIYMSSRVFDARHVSAMGTMTTFLALVAAIWIFQTFLINRNWRITQYGSTFIAALLGLVWIAPYYNAGGTMNPWFTIFIDVDTVSYARLY